MSDQPKKYFVRLSKEDDFQKISEFYQRNTTDKLMKREADLIKQMASDGAIVMIEDTAGKVVAASISYAHTAPDANGVPQVNWQEVGTTQIELNGYPGLFDAMITMQVMRTFLVEPPEKFFVAMMEEGHVQKMAERLGWRRLEGGPEKALLDSQHKGAPSEPVSAHDWFMLGMEGMPAMAGRMIKVMDNPILENKKTGEKIELDFSKSSFFKMFEKEIRNLSGKTYGNADKPDLNDSVKKRRDEWLKHFFR